MRSLWKNTAAAVWTVLGETGWLGTAAVILLEQGKGPGSRTTSWTY